MTRLLAVPALVALCALGGCVGYPGGYSPGAWAGYDPGFDSGYQGYERPVIYDSPRGYYAPPPAYYYPPQGYGGGYGGYYGTYWCPPGY